MKCEHDGCAKTDTVECIIDGDEGRDVEHLCHEHAIEAGHCPICGDFYAGTTYFDIRLICENCHDQIKADTHDPNVDDEDFYEPPAGTDEP